MYPVKTVLILGHFALEVIKAADFWSGPCT